MQYEEFLKSKMAISTQTGFEVANEELTSSLYPHVKDSVKWCINGGCRAIFSAFGMQKTVTQLEVVRLIIKHKGGKGLIVCPKRVVVEFKEQSEKHLGITIEYIKNMQEVENSTSDILVTNYERVRDGNIEPSFFTVASLDEASVLRSYGSKTYQTFLPLFRDVPYKFVATATPAPNRYKEMIHYAGYLGIMDTGQALTRFFKRDSTKANKLTLYPHKEKEFWLWVSTWALFLTSPSDLGYSDEGYNLPPLDVKDEIVDVDNSTAGADSSGQMQLYRIIDLSLSGAAKERRETLVSKIERITAIINRPENKEDSFIFWHDLEDERRALCSAIPGCKAVYGTQDDDEADQIIDDFKNGRLKYLAAKPEMLGEGINFQYHCHKAIMFIDYKFNDKFQAIHRIHRFMQKHAVSLYLVYAISESEIHTAFMQKWQQHNDMVKEMRQIVIENGLNSTNAAEKMMRYMFASREEKNGKLWRAINNDNVIECRAMEDNSVGLIVTSVPFSNHYEYTPTYNDFGHNDDNNRFFEQMNYLTPELYRILQPGRILCVHVKDRILFGNATGLGFPTLDPFHALCIMHYQKHGFNLLGMTTVDTDVVRENNQTYRLGYSEMLKDATKMGVGCPEYVLIFRKKPSDLSNAYADVPVTKERTEYSLSRWQIDAHADYKSSGNRFLSFEEIRHRTDDIADIRRFFRTYQKEHLYNYEEHVAFAEELESYDKLPKTFMAIDPVSKKDHIWDDVTRMRTLNTNQSQKNRVNHICPLQLDIVERLITRYSNKGDIVFDPFGGIMTVPYCAVKLGRKGMATELNHDYWRDGITYLVDAEQGVLSPTLFDLLGYEE